MKNFAKFTENTCDGCKLQTLLEKRHERKRFSAILEIFLEQVFDRTLQGDRFYQYKSNDLIQIH